VKKGRDHFARVLHEIGFISTNSPSDHDANINSRNTILLRAIICAGLYPNVGIIKTKGIVEALG
jgi:ATP-dependent RNA helicase DHX36